MKNSIPSALALSALVLLLVACGPSKSIAVSAPVLYYTETSPEGKPFSSNIFVVGGDGSNRLKITETESIGLPRWSPAAGKITFSSNRSGQPEIFVMDALGSNQTRLTTAGGISPAWSPDGSKIAFTSERDGNSEIYVMDADSSNQTRLTHSPSRDINPSWSPDGSKIAFVARVRIEQRLEGWRSSLNTFSVIYVMDSDGNGQTRLSNIQAFDFRPTWSPDGTKIAFESFVHSADTGSIFRAIHLMDADGSNQTRLTNTVGYSPAWSPDGGKIAFHSQGDSQDIVWGNEIYSVDADGSNQVRITNNSSLDEVPVWSPDGGRLLFMCAEPGKGKVDLCAMDVDGSNRTNLTDNPPASLSFGAWAPGITSP